MKTLKNWSILIALGLSFTLVACGGDDHDNHEAHTDAADAADASDASDASDAADAPAYSYKSNIEDFAGESSVSYTGQVARHLLLNEVTNTIGAMDVNTTFVAGQVIDLLDSYYRFDSDVVTNLPLTTTTTPGAEANLEDISTGKKLQDKMAGVDSTGWDVTTFGGWSTPLPTWTRDEAGNLLMGADAAPSSPNAMVESMFARIEELALAHTAGNGPQDPDGNTITTLYVDADGVDYKQMVQKFMGMAVFFSQGTGDYLYKLTGTLNDGDPADNTEAYKKDDAGLPTVGYTAMEHKYDEGYGYFGAARHYDRFTDDEIAGKGGREDWQKYNDADGNGTISFKSEYNFGHSQNAAKRDRGTKDNGEAATDFTADIFDAFVAGRQVIAEADGELTDGEIAALDGHIDTVIKTWEKAIAATVVHYINDVLADMAAHGSDDYSFYNHAKHWSELKGFALGLQFNPNSPLHEVLAAYCYNRNGMHAIEADVTEEECLANQTGTWNPEETAFTRFHRRVGDAPVLASSSDGTSGMGYSMSLTSARSLLKDAYGFADVNVQGW
ncbi:MAG: DUF4856 domain-containing protein [Deltaproteobacteria bacterium]|nr:DUF4856 domain-containing protein [Deltaproteobacteria bacterium]MBT6491292.1 DUF4856 domain-containing protein [Deltaproteobacteria bacterium]